MNAHIHQLLTLCYVHFIACSLSLTPYTSVCVCVSDTVTLHPSDSGMCLFRNHNTVVTPGKFNMESILSPNTHSPIRISLIATLATIVFVTGG